MGFYVQAELIRDGGAYLLSITSPRQLLISAWLVDGGVVVVALW